MYSSPYSTSNSSSSNSSTSSSVSPASATSSASSRLLNSSSSSISSHSTSPNSSSIIIENNNNNFKCDILCGDFASIRCPKNHHYCKECFSGLINHQLGSNNPDLIFKCQIDQCDSTWEKVQVFSIVDINIKEKIIKTLQDNSFRKGAEDARKRFEIEKKKSENDKIREELANIVTGKCPKCSLAFIDFSACCAVNCQCGSYFCVICEDFYGKSRDVHDHVKKCIWNPKKGEYHLPENVWRQANKAMKSQKIEEYIRNLNINIMQLIKSDKAIADIVKDYIEIKDNNSNDDLDDDDELLGVAIALSLEPNGQNYATRNSRKDTSQPLNLRSAGSNFTSFETPTRILCFMCEEIQQEKSIMHIWAETDQFYCDKCCFLVNENIESNKKNNVNKIKDNNNHFLTGTKVLNPTVQSLPNNKMSNSNRNQQNTDLYDRRVRYINNSTKETQGTNIYRNRYINHISAKNSPQPSYSGIEYRNSIFRAMVEAGLFDKNPRNEVLDFLFDRSNFPNPPNNRKN